MNNTARARLGDFIKAYGPSVCNTPTMCQIMLNQYCGPYPAEMQALNLALTSGAVDRLMKTRSGEPWEQTSEPLVKQLVVSGMAEADAHWAVESWARALGKHPEGMRAAPEQVITAMSEPEKPPIDENVVAKAASYTLLVAGSGAAGGALGAMAVMLALGLMVSATADMTRKAEVSQAVNTFVVFAVIIQGFLGAMGGGIGGAAGWLLGKGGGRRPWKAVTGSFSGAFLAAAIGGRFGGIFGVFFGSLFASFGAALTGAYQSS